MEIEALLKLYNDFFENVDKNHEGYPDEIEAASEKEVDKLISDFDLFVPDDIRAFWRFPKTVHTISKYTDKTEWEAGFDFCEIDIIRRDIPMYRNDLAPNYDDTDPIKRLHLHAVPLSYSEPALIYDADPNLKRPAIYLMLWDGAPSPEPIAPDFTTFFTHWLASGCFRGRDFKAYWEVVKEFVPMDIPLKENLWLNYYSRLYKVKDMI